MAGYCAVLQASRVLGHGLQLSGEQAMPVCAQLLRGRLQLLSHGKPSAPALQLNT